MIRTGTLALALAAGVASADTTSQSIAIDLDTDRGDFGTNLMFDQFDTMGGTRELTGVNLKLNAVMSVEARAESYHPDFIAADTWSADIYHNAFLSFFADAGSAPFYGLGGVVIAGLTGDLTPGSGDPFDPFNPGTPGDPIFAEYSDSIDSVVATSAGFFDYFTGTGSIEGLLGPFTDITVDSGFPIYVEATRMTQLGTLTLEYEYNVVPAPAGLAAFVGLGAIASRRRRG